MISRDVTITNTVGLHARPATFFIQKANSYRSSIWVEREDRRVNAKSLLGVLSLGIVKGTTITLIADGADETEALDGLAALLIERETIDRKEFEAFMKGEAMPVEAQAEQPAAEGEDA